MSCKFSFAYPIYSANLKKIDQTGKTFQNLVECRFKRFGEICVQWKHLNIFMSHLKSAADIGTV